MTAPDLAKISTIIAEVAAQEIMPRFRMLMPSDIEKKQDGSLVTLADKEAERVLTARLTDAVPGSVVVGEENFATDPSILSRLDGDDYVWMIDPIDGTSHFAKGHSQFGTMVGLVRNKHAVAGWIYAPECDHMLSAERGAGVWLNGHKMRLAAHDAHAQTVAIIGSRLHKLMAKSGTAAMLARLPPFETGSAAAFDYGRLFTGDSVFGNLDHAPRAGHLLYRQAKPWDHIPGLALLAEAGGYAADLSGQAYDMKISQKGLLVAANLPQWQLFQENFHPLMASLLDSLS